MTWTWIWVYCLVVGPAVAAVVVLIADLMTGKSLRPSIPQARARGRRRWWPRRRLHRSYDICEGCGATSCQYRKAGLAKDH